MFNVTPKFNILIKKNSWAKHAKNISLEKYPLKFEKIKGKQLQGGQKSKVLTQ